MSLTKSFLVVDDSIIMRRLVTMTLRKMGCTRITDAPNGLVGLEKLAAGGFDLVLTDIDMPEMNGLEFIARARAAHADLPIVILSTHSNEAMRDRGLSLGATAYLTKPLSGAKLLDLLEEIFPDMQV